MHLSAQQIQTYSEKGYLFVPDLLREADVRSLREQLPTLYEGRDPSVVREGDDSARIVFGTHLKSSPFHRLARQPRLLGAVESLLEGQVYVHQSKIVRKVPVTGEGVRWHQDFGFWTNRDGVTTPRMLSAVVFLDAVTAFNGPIYILAGSHRESLLEAGNYELQPPTVMDLGKRYGLEAPEGRAGSVLFLHSMVAHASPTNVSPQERCLAFLTFNAVENRPTRVNEGLPAFVSGTDYNALTPLAAGEAL